MSKNESTPYFFGKIVNCKFDDAVIRMTEALKKEGFGILTDIDMAATFKMKLNKEMPPYHIFGVCNPQLASLALETDPSIGLLLPCNIVVRQDDLGEIHVEIMDPDAALKIVNNTKIDTFAVDVKNRLQRVLDAI